MNKVATHLHRVALVMLLCGIGQTAHTSDLAFAYTQNTLAQAQPSDQKEPQTQNSNPTPADNQEKQKTQVFYPWILAGYALLLVAFPFALMWTDIRKAYAFAHETRELLMNKISADKLTLDELKALITEFDTSPPGIPGLARATLALTLLLLLGLVMFYLVVAYTGKIPDGIEKLLTALTTAFASVVAFYFGTKAASGGQGGAGKGPSGPPPPPPSGQAGAGQPGPGGSPPLGGQGGTGQAGGPGGSPPPSGQGGAGQVGGQGGATPSGGQGGI
jgi:hypothetical protein